MVNRVRQAIDGYTPEQRADLGRLVAVGLLGLILGLFIGWVVWPLEQTNSTLDDLRPDLRANYLAALADAYVAAGGQNPEITLARLGEIDNPPAAIADAIRFYQANPSAASAVAEINLRTLAAALGEEEAVIRSLQAEEATSPNQDTGIEEPDMGWLPWLLVTLTALILLIGGLWIAYQLLRQRYEEAQQTIDQRHSANDTPKDSPYIDSAHQLSRAEQMAKWHDLENAISRPDTTPAVHVPVTVQRTPAAPPSEPTKVVSETEVWPDADDARFDNDLSRGDEEFDEEFDEDDFEDSDDFGDDEAFDDEDEDEYEEDEEAQDEEDHSAAPGANVAAHRSTSAERPSSTPDPGAPPLETPSSIPDTERSTTASNPKPSEIDEDSPSPSPLPPPLPGPATAASLHRKPLPVAASKPTPAEAESGRANLQDRWSSLWRKDPAERRDDVIGRFTARYQYGIADYEESFIITRQDELLGACGMGIDKELDPKAASNDKVHVIDVWFYDRTHLHTYNQLIVSRSTNWDKLTGKANNSGTVTGDPLVAAPGVTFKLQGKDLILDCRIDSVEYLNESDPQSPLRDVTVTMSVRKKK